MPVWASLLLVVFFLAMNGFFVIAEFACVRVRKSQIDLACEQGKPGAKNAREITNNVNSYLAACQLGITLASLALGWLGEPAFAALLRPLFDLLGLPEAVVVAICTALGFVLMTLLHVVAGEQIPKVMALFDTEAYALATATPLRWFYRITYPVMVVFTAITNGAVRLLGKDTSQETEAYTDEELKLLIDESTESGLIDPEQNEFVDNIFDLGEKDAEAIMTPRTDMVCVDLEDALDETLRTIKNYKFTRYPVCQGSKDRIVGFVHVKDLYTSPDAKTIDDLRIRTMIAVPESVPIAKLLQTLQEHHTKIAVVVDEHGGTSGIVTMSDVMEQIVGRTQDEYAHGDNGRIVNVAPDVWQIDGSLPIDEACELIGFVPEEADECETAGGLLLSLFDRIPEEGDSTVASSEEGALSALFTVVEMDNLRIDKIQVRITRRKEPATE